MPTIKQPLLTEAIRKDLIHELALQNAATPAQKDILLVVHNQHDYVKQCLESLRLYTKNYRLFVWDNASDQRTKNLLREHKPCLLVENTTNLGFIRPNNYLASLTSSDYIILLNSDTVVREGWDMALLGVLQSDPTLGCCGYQGKIFNAQGMSVRPGWGNNVDYLEGWCLCLRQSIYQQIGLFSPEFEFAYCEDSDFCLRVKEAGYKIYAMRLGYVSHRGGATSEQVWQQTNLEKTFARNQAKLVVKWQGYLQANREELNDHQQKLRNIVNDSTG